VSVQIRIGDRTADALILSIDPGIPAASGNPAPFRVRAILPSDTPLGEAVVLVDYKGEVSTGPKAFRVVTRDFGLYSTADGSTAAQNISSSGALRANTPAESATPGQLVVLWGTGLGAASGDEAAGPAPENLGIQDLQVLVTDQPAHVVYAGRSGCCAGVDQIIFEVPEGVEGCSLPVVVRFSHDGSESNGGHLSVSPNGGVCPTGLPANLIQKFLSGTLVFGSAEATHYQDSEPSLTARFTFGLPRWELGSPYGMPLGSCYANSGLAGANDSVVPQKTGNLDAGRQIEFRTPDNSVSLSPKGVPNNPLTDFTYSASTPPDHLAPGEYVLENGSGGPDVGPFQAGFNLPDLSFQWTNIDRLGPVTASQDLTITWKTGSGDGYVVLAAAYALAPGNEEDILETGFLCVERAEKGAFTIPGRLLWRVQGASFPDILVYLNVSRTVVRRFTAPGLDLGEFSWTTGSSKALKFQ
jgi:uncharacterized protein (TIGR03437 family)